MTASRPTPAGLGRVAAGDEDRGEVRCPERPRLPHPSIVGRASVAGAARAVRSPGRTWRKHAAATAVAALAGARSWSWSSARYAARMASSSGRGRAVGSGRSSAAAGGRRGAKVSTIFTPISRSSHVSPAAVRRDPGDEGVDKAPGGRSYVISCFAFRS